MKSVIILAAALAAVSSPRSVLAQDPPTERSVDSSVVIIDERELLRRYLEEVEKRSDAEVRVELARLKLAREMFRERFSWEKERWREERDEARRSRWIRDYGSAYRAGAARAQEIIHGAPGVSGCRQLELVIQNGSSEFPAGSLEADAYAQGMVAAFPECLNPDWISVMRAMDSELVGVERELIQIQGSLLDQSATEFQRLKLSREVRDRLSLKLEDFLSSREAAVRQSLELDPVLWNRIRANVTALSARIGKDVALQVLPPEEMLSLDSMYRIAFQKRNAGKYQPRVVSWQLAREVTTYLRERNPSDFLVLQLLNRIQSDLVRLEDRQEESWKREVAEIQPALRESMLDFMAELRDGAISNIDPSYRKELTERLLTIKFAVEAYTRWDISTPLALPAVEQVKRSYSRALALAASISSRTELRSLDLRRKMNDRDAGIIILGSRELIGEIPALESYLLGRTAAERAWWLSALIIQN
jgi:hypothetical protein